VWCCSLCGAIYYKDFPRCPNDGGEVVVSSVDPILGKTIGRYVIDRFVGEGGMARVYEAHHATLATKRYAVKVLLGDAGATPTMRKRFAKEAESASRLVHANVVGVTDYGATEGGLPYIVMDFLDGRSIAQLIEDGPIAVPRAIRLARAMCEGLAYAHEAGVVHRDLKPANVIVVRTPAGDEVPRIADFGLAQTVDDKDARLTTTGMAMGTPAYAAPEQMAGKRVDHRADLYGLGMTMFEMLSGGVLPFKGGPMDVATEKAHREAPAFRDVCPGIAIPPGLDALLAALLKRRPNDRPASTADVIAALDAIVLELAVDERAATVGDPRRMTPLPQKPARKGSWLVPAAIAAAVGVGGAGWYATRAPAETTSTAPALAAAAPAVAATAVPVAVPGAVPAPAPAPVPVPVPVPAPAPAPVAVPAPKAAPKRHTHRGERARQALVAPVHVELAAPSPSPQIVVQPPAPVPAPPAPPPPTPAPSAPIHAAIAAVDVHGSLPAADVRRAIDRALPAIEHCSPRAAQNVTAQLTIGESRRAEGVRASGGTAATCVGTALAAVRTESAPDVGEVEVTVHVKFAEQR